MRACPRCHQQYPDDQVACAADGEALLPALLLPPQEQPLAPGQAVGEYVVEGKLGAGAFGTVYRAAHPVIGKKVAIKVLSLEFSVNPEMVGRFVDEARAVNQIGHRNIIDIFAFGRLPDGRQYYVMELLRGVTLTDYVRERGRLSLQEAVPILRGVARALDAAHKAGIAHRDLKPDNVLVTDDDGKAFPKLLDFGIAKLMSREGGLSRTQTGLAMGTPNYMSPEQCRGREVDHRTDMYAFGILTYQVLTGHLPFVGDDFVEIITRQCTEEPAPPSSLHADLPAEVDEVVAWLMRKAPADRPSSFGPVIEALDAAAASSGLEVNTGVTRLSAGERAQLASTMGLTGKRTGVDRLAESAIGPPAPVGAATAILRPRGGGAEPARATGQVAAVGGTRATGQVAAVGADAAAPSPRASVPAYVPPVAPPAQGTAVAAAPRGRGPAIAAGLVVVALAGGGLVLWRRGGGAPAAGAAATPTTPTTPTGSAATQTAGAATTVAGDPPTGSGASPTPGDAATPSSGGPTPGPGAAAVTGSAAPTASGGPTTTGGAAAGGATVPPADAAAPEVATVAVEIVGVPSGTEVRLRGGAVLGTAPGTVRLPRGDAPVTLELRKAGYALATEVVVPRDAQRLAPRLARLAVSTGATGSTGASTTGGSGRSEVDPF